MKKLTVLYKGWGQSWPLGTLADDGRVLLFEYSAPALQRGYWKLSPAYDLTFSHGPGGEHQMDVCGEGMHPGRAHLLRLAHEAEVPPALATAAITTVCHLAGQFAQKAAAFAIRQTTVRQMDAAVQANVARLLASAV